MSPSPVIILTGASRGLGLSVLKILLSRYNARVSTLARSYPPELKAVEEEYGQDRLLVIQGDAGKVGDNQSVVQRTVEKWGAVDGIVMNAGNMNLCRIADLPLEETPDYVNTNLISLLYLIKPALPYLRKSRLGSDTSVASNITGRVILVSSGASAKGYAAWGLYSMVKAGMNSLARTLAAEEKESGVLVYAVRPGVVDTGMQTLLREQGHGVMDPADMTKFMSAFEAGKLLPPDQPGSVIAGLAAVGGPAELSGEYVDWEDERFASLRLQ